MRRRGAGRLLCSPRHRDAGWKGGELQHLPPSEWVKEVQTCEEAGGRGQQLRGVSRTQRTDARFAHKYILTAFWNSKLMEINGGSVVVGCCFDSSFSALSGFSSIGCKSFLETQHTLAYISLQRGWRLKNVREKFLSLEASIGD